MPNQFYVQPAAGQILQGIGRAVDARQSFEEGQIQAAQQQQLQQKEAELSAAMQSGDSNAVYELMRTNPDLAKNLTEGQGYLDDRRKTAIAQSMSNYLAGGDVERAVREQVEIFGNDRESVQGALQWGMMPEGEQKQKMAEMALAMNASPEQWAQYQAASGSVKPEQAIKLDLEREKLEMRRLENEQRALDRELARETNELKRDELRGKVEAQKLKIEEKQQQMSQQVSKQQAGVKSTQRLIDEMLNHEGLGKAVGLRSILPTVPGGDAADYEVLLETLKSQQFLNEIQQMKGMGALSNAEGQKIAAAAEALSLTQSPTAHRQALKRIVDGLKTIAEPGTYGGEKKQEQAATKTVNWADM